MTVINETTCNVGSKATLDYTYALTIKNTQLYACSKDKKEKRKIADSVNRESILDILETLEGLGWNIDHIQYETLTKTGKPCPLHVHCRARHLKRPYPFPTYPMWHLYFVKEYDSKGWDSYSLKQQIREDQHNTTVRFSNQYMFSSDSI